MGDPFPRTPGSAGITGNLPTPSPRHMGLRPTPPGHPSQPALRETALSTPYNVRLTDLSTPSQRRINTPEAVSTLSTPYQHRGKTWEGLPKTSPGGLAKSWPGGCPVVQCQSRGAGCRCTGVQWSRSAQVLIRTRAHLTFRFYFHPRTAFSRLQNGPCLRQTCPLRFKNAIWRVPRRVPSQWSIFRVPSQRPNLGAAAALAGRAAKNFSIFTPRGPASTRQVPGKYPASCPSLRGIYLLYFMLSGVRWLQQRRGNFLIFGFRDTRSDILIWPVQSIRELTDA